MDLATARQWHCHCCDCTGWAVALPVAVPVAVSGSDSHESVSDSVTESESVVEARPKFNLRYVDSRDGSAAGQFKEIRD